MREFLWERALTAIGEFYNMYFTLGTGGERGLIVGVAPNEAIYRSIVCMAGHLHFGSMYFFRLKMEPSCFMEVGRITCK